MVNHDDGDAHVFVSQHQGFQVEIFDVAGHEFCAWGGDNAVQEKLGDGYIGG